MISRVDSGKIIISNPQGSEEESHSGWEFKGKIHYLKLFSKPAGNWLWFELSERLGKGNQIPGKDKAHSKD